jgi:hypothetical protein
MSCKMSAQEERVRSVWETHVVDELVCKEEEEEEKTKRSRRGNGKVNKRACYSRSGQQQPKRETAHVVGFPSRVPRTKNAHAPHVQFLLRSTPQFEDELHSGGEAVVTPSTLTHDTTGPHIRREVLRNGHLYVIAERLGAQVLLSYGRYRLRPPGGETGT